MDSLLTGATDVEDIMILGAMFVLPRIAEWCAIYLVDDQGPAWLAHGWHADERMLGRTAGAWCSATSAATGPEAAAVTGLARHPARLLARDGHGATAVLDRLNRVVADDAYFR